jgi:hypothetical protein
MNILIVIKGIILEYIYDLKKLILIYIINNIFNLYIY